MKLALQMRRLQHLALQIGILSRQVERLTTEDRLGEGTNEWLMWGEVVIRVGVKAPTIQLLNT